MLVGFGVRHLLVIHGIEGLVMHHGVVSSRTEQIRDIVGIDGPTAEGEGLVVEGDVGACRHQDSIAHGNRLLVAHLSVGGERVRTRRVDADQSGRDGHVGGGHAEVVVINRHEVV